MRLLLLSCGRAIVSQLRGSMLMLTFIPFMLSLLLWGLALWFGLQPLIDGLQRLFVEYDGFRISGNLLGMFDLGALKTILVPLLAMWLLLPLMIVTALGFIGVAAMPAIIWHVAERYYPGMERRHGGTLLGSVATALLCFLAFLGLWLLTLPLSLIPPLAFLIHTLLWGWLTYRVMVYDALAEHADRAEHAEILRRHRWPLLVIGICGGTLGAMPTLLWLGGVLSVVLFPLFAAVSVWLYVLIFVFTGLWFQHYCLAALAQLRAGAASGQPELPAPPV
jgi:hypothetical protein